MLPKAPCLVLTAPVDVDSPAVAVNRMISQPRNDVQHLLYGQGIGGQIATAGGTQQFLLEWV